MRRSVFLLAIPALVVGCASLLGLDAIEYVTRDDAGADDGAISDGAIEGAAADAAEPTFTYNDFKDPTNWETIDLATVHPVDHGGSGWRNVVFDGAYVYFGPASIQQPVLAYGPVGAAFNFGTSWHDFARPWEAGAPASWTTGVSLCGGRLTLTPASTSTVPLSYRVPSDPYEEPWSEFDLSSLGGNPTTGHGYAGCDGRYLYVPSTWSSDTGNPVGDVVRIDPAALPAATSAVLVDLKALNAEASNFSNVVSDGRYLYFVPGSYGLVARYDTQQTDPPFDKPTGNAWAYVDLRKLGFPTKFKSATFDGRNVYFWASKNGDLRVVRFDTRGSFTDTSSSSPWKMLNLVNKDPVPDPGLDAGLDGYHTIGGTTFDGRYVYAVDWDVNWSVGVGLFRLDTQAPFAPGAVTSVPLATIFPSLSEGLRALGLGFDGQYVYMPTSYGNIIARFNARSPRAPLRISGGSSF